MEGHSPHADKTTQLDSSYEVYKIVTPANGLVGDLHEFKITEQGTAMMTSYEAVQTDLSTFGIIGEGWIYDSVFQEIDLETGKLIFEWHASDHYSVEESYHNPGEAGKTSDNAWDFFHINSISKTDEGNYIISSRYMFTVTCISPKGDILWILGGKRNYFTDLSEGAASNFSWQHDARWLGSVGNVHTITVFDNGKFDRWSPNADYSRGLMISLDVENWTAEVLHTYIEPHHALAPSQGSVQMLPETNNNVFVGWGYYSAYTEFSLEAEVLCNVHIAPEIFFNLGWVKSYRAFRTSLWHGYPKTQPSVSLKSSDKTLYVSWNGATDVSSLILQGSDSDSDSDLHFSHSDTFTNLSTTPKTKFETQITVTKETPQYIRIAALDASGKILGYSEPMDRTKGNIPFWDGFVGTLFLVLGMIIGVAVPYYIYLRRRRSKILFSSSTAKYTILGSHGHSGKAKWLMILDSLPFRKRDPESRSRRRRRRSRRTSGDKSSPAVMEIMGFDSLSSQHHSEYDDDGIGKGEERQGNDHHELRRFID